MNRENAKNVLKVYRSSEATVVVGENGTEEHFDRTREHEESVRNMFGAQARGLAGDASSERIFDK